ncbi:MAG: peptidoglycan-binding domain-containing protein [Hyphomicrobiaceae bacterium]
MRSMFQIFSLLAVLWAFGFGALQRAQALTCQGDAVTATSRLYVSKSLGAYPASWAAWRKAVKSKLGDGWQAWRRSQSQSIECEKVKNDAGRLRWQCTRTAVPCKPGEDVTLAYCDGSPISSNLRKGDVGEEVKTLQCLLNAYYGARLTVDGEFGLDTRDAVRVFQKEQGLHPDGVVGNRTLEKLLS